MNSYFLLLKKLLLIGFLRLLCSFGWKIQIGKFGIFIAFFLFKIFFSISLFKKIQKSKRERGIYFLRYYFSREMEEGGSIDIIIYLYQYITNKNLSNKLSINQSNDHDEFTMKRRKKKLTLKTI